MHQTRPFAGTKGEFDPLLVEADGIGVYVEYLVGERVRLSECAHPLELPDRSFQLRDPFVPLAVLDQRLAKPAVQLGVARIALQPGAQLFDANGELIVAFRRLPGA